jgi:hypothetical protein
MTDSIGDGWAGSFLTIAGVDYILDDLSPDCTSWTDCYDQGLDGQTAIAEICISEFDTTTYNCDGSGAYPSNIGWSVSCPGDLHFVGNCPMGPGALGDEVPGCTDSTAYNFDVLATVDDGSCVTCNSCVSNIPASGFFECCDH